MWNNRILCSLLFFISCSLSAQDCKLNISGVVSDLGTGEDLEAVYIYISEIASGTVSAHNGSYEILDLCPGSYHLTYSHIGCESYQTYIDLQSDTILDITLEHSTHSLDRVTIVGSDASPSTKIVEAINEQSISDQSGENLANLLETISGVATLRNGSTISKPVVQGLYGNRVTILNNGIAQGGQQWGNDHSPEIDPLIANRISVVKGVSALQYPGSNLGSVVIVEPKNIGNEPHIHGKSSYFFESNGRSHGLNLQMQQYTPFLAWKVNGTLKKSGDRHAPDYFLNNTGQNEANFAFQLEKSFSSSFKSNLYYSSYNTRIGVMRGSHIGNLTDLESAFDRGVPFFTEEEFSYTIDAPRQDVNHHLLKINSKWFLDDSRWFDFTIAEQLNSRKEFDIRRGERGDKPALSLRQFTTFLEAKYNQEFINGGSLKSGLQLNHIYNTNNPGTGILPLIPDYASFETGFFSLATFQRGRSLLEIGGRYDFIFQEAATISGDLPRRIIRERNLFHNIALSSGWSYEINDDLHVLTNLGLATRNPAINELFSAGLHQGVSGIEEGNVDLDTEQSLKLSTALHGHFAERLLFEGLVYYQRFQNYIFLNPGDQVRLTIRGAFPVFTYEQTDAEIFGFDLTSEQEWTNNLSTRLVYAHIVGNDLSQNLGLINLPGNTFDAELRYEFSNYIDLGRIKLENMEISISDRYVQRQRRLIPEQDFIDFPDSYNLVNTKVAFDLAIKSYRFRIIAAIDNLLNTEYRDYLNRQRYFADDLGRNIKLGLNMKF